jgi:photosystem II stability/assembly factor-like uncharacterized protein
MPLALLIAGLTLIGCAPASDLARWQQEQNRDIAERLAQVRQEEGQDSLSLSISKVVRLDVATVVLGGAYRTAAGDVQAVILVSNDNARTWRDTGVAVAGSCVLDFIVADPKHAWAVVCWTMESTGAPYYVFSTNDGGHTWRRCSTPLPVGEPSGLWDLWQWHFTDPSHGTLVLDQTAGFWRMQVATTDGGDYWKLASRVPIDPTSAEASPLPQPTQLRAAPKNSPGVIQIQQCDNGGTTWRTLGTLAGDYPLAGPHP